MTRIIIVLAPLRFRRRPVFTRIVLSLLQDKDMAQVASKLIIFVDKQYYAMIKTFDCLLLDLKFRIKRNPE
jgi:hypothetical protein